MHEVTSFKRVIVMHEGRLLMDGTPTDIFARADELREVGLDVPMITSLGKRLRTKGWAGLPGVILSTDQLKDTLHASCAKPGWACPHKPPLQGSRQDRL